MVFLLTFKLSKELHNANTRVLIDIVKICPDSPQISDSSATDRTHLRSAHLFNVIYQIERYLLGPLQSETCYFSLSSAQGLYNILVAPSNLEPSDTTR